MKDEYRELAGPNYSLILSLTILFLKISMPVYYF